MMKYFTFLIFLLTIHSLFSQTKPILKIQSEIDRFKEHHFVDNKSSQIDHEEDEFFNFQNSNQNSSQFSKPVLLYQYGFNRTLRSLYNYNEKGNLLSYLGQENTSGSWNNQYNDSCEYDEKGNLVLKISKIWKDGDWQNYKKFIYTYDSNNRVLSYQTVVWYREYIDFEWVEYWKESSKYTYEYYTNGKLKSRSWHSWRELSRWSYTYDTRGNMLSEKLEDYRGGDDLENVYRTLFTYDTRNNCLSSTGQYWYENQWINSEKYSYKFDDDNRVIFQQWEDRRSDQLKPIYRSSFTYEDGKLMNKLVENYTYETWQNGAQIIYQYNSNDSLYYEVWQDWNDNGWFDTRKDSTFYDERGYKMKRKLVDLWDTTWTVVGESDFTHDESGRLLTLTSYSGNTGVWTFYNRQTNQYDEFGNRKSLLWEKWENNEWKKQTLYNFTYDNHGNWTSAEAFTFQNDLWDKLDAELPLFYNSYADTIRASGYKVEATYQQFDLTSVADENQNIKTYNLSQNYPNPFNPTTVINFELPEASQVKLKIYNLLGQEIATLVNEEKPVGRHSVQFNASTLSSGIYIYQIKANNFIQSKKMILMK